MRRRRLDVLVHCRGGLGRAIMRLHSQRVISGAIDGLV
jgi:hypothetical protein